MIVPTNRLSQIETRWSLLLQAHCAEGPPDSEAQTKVLELYAGGVYRYLLGATRDPHVADDLTQEFALRFLRGDFHRARPGRGQFRNYVRRAVRNLLIDFQRDRSREAQCLKEQSRTAPQETAEVEAELQAEFLECLREELLSRAWEKLKSEQEVKGGQLYLVLRYRTEHPSMRSHVMADGLGALLGRSVTADWVRQSLSRARRRFLEILREEATILLGEPDGDEVDVELKRLGFAI